MRKRRKDSDHQDHHQKTAEEQLEDQLEGRKELKVHRGIQRRLRPRDVSLQDLPEGTPDHPPHGHTRHLGDEAREVRGDYQHQPADEKAPCRQRNGQKEPWNELPETNNRLGLQPNVIGHPESLPDQETEQDTSGDDPDEAPDLLDDGIIPGESRGSAGENIPADISPGQTQKPDLGLLQIPVIDLPLAATIDRVPQIRGLRRETTSGNTAGRIIPTYGKTVGPGTLPEAVIISRNADVGGDLKPMLKPPGQRHVLQKFNETLVVILNQVGAHRIEQRLFISTMMRHLNQAVRACRFGFIEPQTAKGETIDRMSSPKISA